MPRDYLIVVDVQNDFLPGGALGVPKGDEVIDPINELIIHFEDRIVYTQDVHPAGHCSFASTHDVDPFTRFRDEIVWPDHCMTGTDGVCFPEGLFWGASKRDIVMKGSRADSDSYSGFFEGMDVPSKLPRILRSAGATRVFVCGLATDYCVKATALDAVRQGFRTSAVVDACRGVDATPGDVEDAYVELVRSNVKLVGVDEVVNPSGRRLVDLAD